ncbi:MAG: hypothetical protein AAGA21_14825 [Pseudomonadota bacterium]
MSSKAENKQPTQDARRLMSGFGLELESIEVARGYRGLRAGVRRQNDGRQLNEEF